MGVLEVPEHTDTANHNVPADLVHVERRPDGSQHQDRQQSTQVLPELVQAVKDGRPVVVSVQIASKLGGVDREAERRQERHDAPPVVFRQKPAQV